MCKEFFFNEFRLFHKVTQPNKVNLFSDVLMDNPVHINYSLTSTNRKLFWVAKKVIQEYKSKDVWSHSNGIKGRTAKRYNYVIFDQTTLKFFNVIRYNRMR